MKKSFFFVMMAAAALIATPLFTACSDDDDDDIESTEGDELENPNEFIMEHIVVLDDNYDFVRYGLYGGNPSETDSKVMVYYLENDETPDSIFRELVPSNLDSQIEGTSGNLSLAYEKDGKSYTLSMTSRQDGSALITLPDASPWSNYATALEVIPTSAENADIPEALTNRFQVGKGYYAKEMITSITFAGHPYISSEMTLATYEPTNKYVNDCEYLFYCVGMSKNAAYFVFVPETDDEDNTNPVPNLQMIATNVGQHAYLSPYVTTNFCYDNGTDFLPTASELKAIRKVFPAFLEKYLRVTWHFNDQQVEEADTKYTFAQWFESIFGAKLSSVNFATSEKSEGSLVTHKKVKYVNFNAKPGTSNQEQWMNKNSKNYLPVMYIHKIMVANLAQ